MDEPTARQQIVAQCRHMNAIGLNAGTSGNISVRWGGAMLITPSAMPYDRMTAADIASVPLDGAGEWSGPHQPSTEWRFHRDILRGRPDAGAVVHTHATHCTALAIARRAIPPCHYMIAAFGGADIRCAPYARFGTQDLADHALAALQGRTACLLANHGMIAIGPDLAKAMWLAEELETLAKQYLLSLQLGGPHLLTEREIAEALAAFSTYGLQSAPKPAHAAD